MVMKNPTDKSSITGTSSHVNTSMLGKALQSTVQRSQALMAPFRASADSSRGRQLFNSTAVAALGFAE